MEALAVKAKIRRNQVVRYNANPFKFDLTIKKKRETTQLNPIGQEKNVAIFDKQSGEMIGQEIVSYKKVDASQFVKVYTSQIGMIFNLSSAGNKAFQILLWQLQHIKEQDFVELSMWTLQEFVESNYLIAKDSDQDNGFQTEMFEDKPQLKLKGYSIAVFRRGLAELVKNQIIANSIRLGWFYINPSMVFNGNRMVFTSIIDIENTTKLENVVK